MHIAGGRCSVLSWRGVAIRCVFSVFQVTSWHRRRVNGVCSNCVTRGQHGLDTETNSAYTQSDLPGAAPGSKSDDYHWLVYVWYSRTGLHLAITRSGLFSRCTKRNNLYIYGPVYGTSFRTAG